MNHFKTSLLFLTLTVAIGMPAIAQAQNAPVNTGSDVPTTETEGTSANDATAPPNDGDLPTPRSDNDPAPEVASPGIPSGGIVKQAGIGGTVGYGRAGVLELGGSFGFTYSSGNSASSFNMTPSIGWFLADNLEISALLSLNYNKAETADGMSASSTLVSGLIEPSYHIPFNRSTFGFFGLGLGGSHISDVGGGLTIAPRLGGNLMIGRSGVLTPSISYQYTTIDTEANGNQVLLAVSTALRLNIGYTVMW